MVSLRRPRCPFSVSLCEGRGIFAELQRNHNLRAFGDTKTSSHGVSLVNVNWRTKFIPNYYPYYFTLTIWYVQVHSNDKHNNNRFIQYMCNLLEETYRVILKDALNFGCSLCDNDLSRRTFYPCVTFCFPFCEVIRNVCSCTCHWLLIWILTEVRVANIVYPPTTRQTS